MTSREKIRHVLMHQPYEGLAIDFGAMRSTGINALAYNKLTEYLGLDRHAVLYDVFQQIALPDISVVNRFGGDVMQVHRLCPAFGISIKRWKESRLRDGSKATVPFDYNPVPNKSGGLDIIGEGGRVVARMPAGGLYFDLVYHKFEHVNTEAEVSELAFPSVSDEELDFMECQSRELYENTDKAILLCFGGNIFEQGQLDFGYEKFYTDLVLNPGMLHAYFTRLTDAYLEDLRKILAKVGRYVDVIQFGDDLGTQISSQISVDMYRSMIMPYHQKLYAFVRGHYPGVSVFLHSCGAISALLPSLVEAGVQVLNPVQISAKDMDPRALKREFGKDLVFWGGGADMQNLVTYGDPEAIRNHVGELIDIFNADGTGFVFTQVHNIQYGIAPEKVCAVYDTARAYAAGRCGC